MMLIVLWSMLPHPDSLLLVELYVITQIEDYPGESLERRRCIYAALILLSHRCQHHWHFLFPSQATMLHMQPRLTITLLFLLPKPNQIKINLLRGAMRLSPHIIWSLYVVAVQGLSPHPHWRTHPWPKLVSCSDSLSRSRDNRLLVALTDEPAMCWRRESWLKMETEVRQKLDTLSCLRRVYVRLVLQIVQVICRENSFF